MIAKVYFPRLVIPLASVLSALVDFLASFVILIVLMMVYRITPTWAVLSLPLFILLAGAAGLGIGLWLACLSVKFHDVAIGLSFGIDVLKYLTPVAYSATLIPERWQTLYRLNPMTGVVEGFRWALLGVGRPPMRRSWYLAGLALLLLVTGAFTFRRTERTIVDVL